MSGSKLSHANLVNSSNGICPSMSTDSSTLTLNEL